MENLLAKCKTSKSKVIRIRSLFRMKYDISDSDSSEEVSKVRDELSEQEIDTHQQYTRTHTVICAAYGNMLTQ